MGGMTAGAAMNTKGFESAVRKGVIPSVDHITYPGAFNEQYFRVGVRTDKELDLAIGVSACNTPIDSNYLGTKNHFLSLFLKSCRDGKPRVRPIHAVLVLDISASMKQPLDRRNSESKSRLALAREAIKKLYSKLTPNDYFGLVLFEDTAKTLIASHVVGQHDKSWVFAKIDADVELGGTNLRAGLTQAQKHFEGVNYKGGRQCYERRIVMLTDVNDNSLLAQDQFVQQLSTSKIHCSIVGISDQFRSETCQKLIKTAGFNYFCATEDSDMNLHLIDHFDYTFFPVASNIKIWLQSANVQGIDVYGTPDSTEISPFGVLVGQYIQRFFVTAMNSSFPSDYGKDSQQQEVTKGGLIMVMLVPRRSTQTRLECRIVLEYDDLNGQKQLQKYQVNQQLGADDFHSSDTAQKAARIFYYVYCLRAVLTRMNSDGKRLSYYNRRSYIQNLQLVKGITPKDKQKDVDRLIELVERFPQD